MPRPGTRPPLMTGLGLRAFKGGAVVVGLSLAEGTPRVFLSTVLETCVPGDRMAFEPYGVAAEAPRGPEGRVTPEVKAIVAAGRQRQEQLAAKGLKAIIQGLAAQGCRPSVAALLVNRAGWITDLLEYSLAWAEHVPVAENLAVRDALRFAIRHGGVEAVELDEKSLPDVAMPLLSVSSTLLETQLKALGSSVGKPWRKEQKLACLAAWVALARPRIVEKGTLASSSLGTPTPGREP